MPRHNSSSSSSSISCGVQNWNTFHEEHYAGERKKREEKQAQYKTALAALQASRAKKNLISSRPIKAPEGFKVDEVTNEVTKVDEEPEYLTDSSDESSDGEEESEKPICLVVKRKTPVPAPLPPKKSQTFQKTPKDEEIFETAKEQRRRRTKELRAEHLERVRRQRKSRRDRERASWPKRGDLYRPRN